LTQQVRKFLAKLSNINRTYIRYKCLFKQRGLRKGTEGKHVVGHTRSAVKTPMSDTFLRPQPLERSHSILELALHGLSGDVLDLLLTAHDQQRYQPGAERTGPNPVTFVTPTSAHTSRLSVLADLDGVTTAQFLCRLTCDRAKQPSSEMIERWNRLGVQGALTHDDDGHLVLRMDVALVHINLKDIIPLWLTWDRCVERAQLLTGAAPH
jgi:hypothetical protein